MSDPTRFHLSMNVVDLDKSVTFFRHLLGIEPAKLRADYAKFEPEEPPLVLSLEPAGEVVKGGALNHVGFRMPDARSLVAMQERLERAGMKTKREDGVECCYARQTKFWAHDPDGNLWEVYTFEGDIEHRGSGQTELQVLSEKAPEQQSQTWEHRMGEPIPSRIPVGDSSADEVRLRGTFNLPQTPDERQKLLSEAARVLRPGGRLFVHVLTGERAVDAPTLPGPAGAVRAVPQDSESVTMLEDAGFIGIRMLKFDSKPCFVRDGIGMRETQLEAFAPSAANDGEVEVMYKGPFREVRDDEGRVFPRGQRRTISGDAAGRLRTGELSSQFVVFPNEAVRPQTLTACRN